MDEDLGRYESAAGWEPRDPYKKRREKIRKQQEKHERRSQPILRHSDESEAGESAAPAEQLFTTLWRTGEVALLFGEPGIGKTLYAVRLAEAIAAGHDWSASVSPALQKPARSKGEKPRRVVYIDLQRTDAQFQQRFSNTAFERLHFDWSRFDADENDNIRAARIHNSISEAIDAGAEVVILDDIALGGINLGRPNGPLRTLRTLKMFAAERGTSFLVIAGARTRKRPRPASLADVAFRHVADQADSVFCLSRSTYGPAFRYVRHLRSASAPIVHDASAVLTFQIGSPPYEGGVAVPMNSIGTDGLVLGSPPARGGVDVLHGRGGGSEFKYLGDCAESEHLRDYAAEALRAERADKRQLRRQWRRTSKEILVDGLIDGSYVRYLKGE